MKYQFVFSNTTEEFPDSVQEVDVVMVINECILYLNSVDSPGLLFFL